MAKGSIEPERWVKKETSEQLQPGKRSLLTGKEFSLQCGHKVFDVRKPVSPGYFVISTCSEQSSLMLCSGSQTYVFYPNENRRDLASLLHLEENQVPPNSAIVGHKKLSTCWTRME